MNRGVQRGVCFTKYLMEKDHLTASMTRLGAGFTPPAAISEAKHHLEEIKKLVFQMEAIAALPKDKDFYCSSHHLQ